MIYVFFAIMLIGVILMVIAGKDNDRKKVCYITGVITYSVALIGLVTTLY